MVRFYFSKVMNMKGLGTIINVLAIIVGGIIGLLFKNVLKERYQETILKATGIAVMFLGISGTISKMLVIQDGSLSSIDTLPMIISLALGAFLGEVLDIDHKIEEFGTWLKVHTGNAKDKNFTSAFVSASLTVCIGAMAIIGALQDGINGDYSVLLAKAILDLIIIMIMTSSLGKGCIFSFIPVGIFQGLVTCFAIFISGFVTNAILSSISLVGNILIFCVGLNLLWPNTIRVANLLPSLIFIIIFTIFF